DIQRRRWGIVNSGHVIPGLERESGVAVSLGMCGGISRDGNPERPAAGVGSSLKLPAGVVVRASYDLAVIGGVAGGINPGAPGHAAGALQGRWVAKIDVGVGAVERQRVPVLAGGTPSGAQQYSVGSV